MWVAKGEAILITNCSAAVGNRVLLPSLQALMDLSNRYWQWAMLLFLAFIWGSSFILMKKALLTFSAEQVGAFRMFAASAVLIPFTWRYLHLLKGRVIIAFIAVGLFGNGIPAFLFAKAQTVVDSAIAGMLNGLVPLFTLVLGLLFFKANMKWQQLTGVSIGLAGALLLIWSNAGGINGPGEQWPYMLLIIAASFCYAISVNTIKTYLSGYPAVAVTGLAMLFIGPLTGGYVFGFTDFGARLQTSTDWLHLGYLLALAVFGTAMAVWLFNKLISHTTALFASTVTYLIPGVAIFWGLLDGETIGVYDVVGIGIILLGIWMIRTRKQKKPAKEVLDVGLVKEAETSA